MAAISYDSPAVLKSFSDRKGIQFPLLSDADSKIIRSYGILNPDPKPGTMTYGIPYPGIYVLDGNGVVKAKYFEDDYKERNTAAVILMKEFGIAPANEGPAVRAKHAMLTTGTSDKDAHMGQHLSLLLDVTLPERVHVYAPGVQGYIPVHWDVPAMNGVEVRAAEYPASKMLRLEAIQETVPVYEGKFQMSRDIVIGNEKVVLPLLDSDGNLTIHGTFRYQACDDKVCFLPESVPLTWTLHYEALDRTRAPEGVRHQ